MTTISIRLPDTLLQEADSRAKAMDLPRAEYIRLAIENLNRELARKRRREQLIEASAKVRGESMRVNAEFSRIERAPD